MEIDELLISTGVDALIKLIKEREKIELETAAKELNVSFSTVKEWAQALEEEKIIKIDYKFTKVYLIWLKESDYILSEKIGDVTTQKEDLKESVLRLKRKLEQTSKEIEITEKELENVNKIFDPKLIEIQKKANRMLEMERNAEENIYRYHSKSEDLKLKLETFIKNLEDKEKEWKTLYEEIGSIEYKTENIEILKKLEEDLNLGLSELNKKIKFLEEKQIEQKEIIKNAEKLETLLTSSKKDVAAIQKIYSNIHEKNKEIEDKQKELKKSLEKTSLTQIKKSLQNVKGNIPEIKNQVETLEMEIEDKLKTIKELEEIYLNFDKISGAVFFETLEKRQETFQKNITDLNTLLKNFENNKEYKIKIKLHMKDLEILNLEISKLKKEIEKQSQKAMEEAKESLKPINDLYSKYTQLKETVLFYYKRMSTLKKESEDQKQLIDSEKNKVIKELEKYKKSIEKDLELMNNTIKDYQGIIKEKNNVDTLLRKIREIREIKNKLIIDLNVLNKKLEILKISKKEDFETKTELLEIGKKVELSEEDEKTLQEKRRELRDMIKKMWEK